MRKDQPNLQDLSSWPRATVNRRGVLYGQAQQSSNDFVETRKEGDVDCVRNNRIGHVNRLLVREVRTHALLRLFTPDQEET